MSDTTGTVNSNSVDSADSAEKHALTTYVSDLLALTKHIEVPVDRQLSIEDSANYSDAVAVIRQIKETMATQRTALETQLASMGGHPAAGVKSAWSALLGVGAAAIGSVRKTKVSKNLRDDYTALGLASISYTMLHATALGIGDTPVAALAARHLEQITPLVIRISTSIAGVVLQELRDDGESVAVSAAEISTALTHKAWTAPN